MEFRKTFFDDTDSEDNYSASEDSSNPKKLQLEKEIDELKTTLKQLKLKLYVNQLNSDTDNDNDNNKIHKSNASSLCASGENALAQIKLDLYKFGGTYCMGISDKKQVIGFHASMRKQHENEYAVQFLKSEKGIETGNWVMPMSVDIKKLKSEVPIDTGQSVLPFVRNCKHHVDCYTSRLQQFQELKSFVENLQNINVQSNLGYTVVILELLRVHDKKNNCYCNMTIYLCYDSKRARPNNIKFEISGSVNYDTEEKKKVKKSLKVFHTNNLQLAFTNILKEDNIQFMWERIEKTVLTRELQESDSTEEDEKKGKRKRVKKKLKKKNTKKKKEDNSSNSSHTENKALSRVKTRAQMSLKTRRNTYRNKSMYQTSLNKDTFKLRSPKKRQENEKAVQSNFNIKPLSIIVKRLNKVYSSTPLRQNPKNKTPFKALPSLDISNINASSTSFE